MARRFRAVAGSDVAGSWHTPLLLGVYTLPVVNEDSYFPCEGFSMKPGPKRQHWLPVFYLRRFTIPETKDSPNPQAWVCWRKAGSELPVRVGIRNLAAEAMLYTPKDGNGNVDWSMEEKLARSESVLAGMWDAVADGFVDPVDHGTRRALALFLALQALRHPSSRDRIVKSRQDLILLADGLADDDLKNYVIEINGQVAGELAWVANQPDEPPAQTFADSIQAFAIHLAKIFLQKRWAVAFTEEPMFITSDNPIFVLEPEFKPFQFAAKGATIVFPLSPTRVLFLDDKTEPDGRYYPFRRENVTNLNYSIWLNAERFVTFGRDPGDVIRELIAVDRNYFPPPRRYRWGRLMGFARRFMRIGQAQFACRGSAAARPSPRTFGATAMRLALLLQARKVLRPQPGMHLTESFLHAGCRLRLRMNATLGRPRPH